uniref:Uncharacterized protein n=1 Tax=Oryza sativa subsp. japonica TaxID=39947 RepID=Q6Z1F0_ORYSJ|nr:hypothetical protein [Oryza sativa Japonica Group]BAD16173.1 hypothetical protein [Oryza sativa Japonica Group]
MVALLTCRVVLLLRSTIQWLKAEPLTEAAPRLPVSSVAAEAPAGREGVLAAAAVAVVASELGLFTAWAAFRPNPREQLVFAHGGSGARYQERARRVGVVIGEGEHVVVQWTRTLCFPIEVAWASTRQRPFGLTLATRPDDETCSTLAPVDEPPSREPSLEPGDEDCRPLVNAPTCVG